MADDDAPREVHVPLDQMTWAEIVKLLDEYGVPEDQREALLDGIGCPCCTPGIVIPAAGRKPRF